MDAVTTRANDGTRAQDATGIGGLSRAEKGPLQIASPDDSSNITELIADSLTPGHPDVVRHLLNAAGARAPEVDCSPDEAEPRNPLLRQFAEICRRYMTPDGKFQTTAIRLEDIGGLTEWLMMIDPVDDGQDMTGRLTSDIGGHVGTFFAGIYMAVHQRGEIAYSEHEPPLNVLFASGSG